VAGEITLTAKSVLAAAQELSQRTREMDKAMEVLLQASSQQHSMHLGEKAKATFDAPLKAAAIFAALKPGGILVIADHSTLPGQGASVGKTFHRIEESTLRKEVEAAPIPFCARPGTSLLTP
jgi:predicted methyltransferase